MSLCDSDNKNQVEASIEYVNLEMSLDSMGLPNAIVCTGSTNNSNVWHNKAKAHMNLKMVYQEKFQDIQELRDQYMSMRKVCDELGLNFGRCEDKTKQY